MANEQLLKDTEDAFYGGGNAQPTPTPTPTPQPKSAPYMDQHMKSQPITPFGLNMHEPASYEHKI